MNNSIIIGKTVGFNDNGKCVPLFVVEKFNKDNKKYYCSYTDGTGEWMPTDILLKNLDNRKFIAEGLDRQAINNICANRTKTQQEKLFNKQLDRAENPHKYMKEY